MSISNIKFKFYVIIIAVVFVFFSVFSMLYNKSNECKTPDGFSKQILKVYSKTLKEAVKIVPPIKNYQPSAIIEDNPQKMAKLVTKLEKLRRNNAQKLQKCAIHYYNMSDDNQKKARRLSYEKVSELYKSNVWQNFIQSLESHPEVIKQMMDIRRVTRYAFIKPLRINSKKVKEKPIN